MESFLKCLIAGFLLLPSALDAEIFCGQSWFSGGAIIQQGVPFRIHGTDTPGTPISLTGFGLELEATTSNEGQWEFIMPALDGGLTSDITIQGNGTIHWRLIQTGEVWMVAGQSNVIFPMASDSEGHLFLGRYLRRLNRQMPIRIWHEPGKIGTVGHQYPSGAWKSFDSENLVHFSAVAGYLGEFLSQSLTVPLGVVVSSWGGTNARMWLPEESVSEYPELSPHTLDFDTLLINDWAAALEQWRLTQTPRLDGRAPFHVLAPGRPYTTGDIYDGMIRPFEEMPVRGIVYYQGESDVYRPHHHAAILPRLITSWRQRRNNSPEELPFFVIQIPGWDFDRMRTAGEAYAEVQQKSLMASLREAQRLAALTTPNTHLICGLDTSTIDDVHPLDKKTLSSRLTRAIRHVVYDQPGLYSGPVLKEATFNGNQVTLTFSGVGDGIQLMTEPVSGFTVASTSGAFRAADAEVTAPDTILVKAPARFLVDIVRYAWNDFPFVALNDSEGNPATSFEVIRPGARD